MMKTLPKLILFNLLFALSVIYLFPAQLKVDLRFALFSNFIGTSDFFKTNPDVLCTTSVPNFKSFKQKYLDEVLLKNEIVPIAFSDNPPLIERVKAIVGTYSKSGGEGCGNYSNDLVENIKWLMKDDGHGCCSDHSQAFVALCLSNKIFAREVHHSKHTFNEYFDDKKQKWIWIDSQCCLLAKDTIANEYLSLIEIREHFEAKKKIHWEFFGTKANKLSNPEKLTSILNEYYIEQPFDVILMTLGNNVYEVNYYNRKLQHLPKEIQQLSLLSVGIQPHYAIFDPKNILKPYFDKIMFALGIFMTCFITINLCIIFPSLRYRLNGYLYKKRNSL